MGETDRLLDVIRGRNSKTVGLQFPVGLRTKAVELAQEIETKAGVTCLVSADPSFGACDVAEMPVDLVVHLGHAPMPHLRYNRVFFYDLPGPPLSSMQFVDSAGPQRGAGPCASTATRRDCARPRRDRLWNHRLEETGTGTDGVGHGAESPRRETREAGKPVPHGPRRSRAAPGIPRGCLGEHGVPADRDRRYPAIQAADAHAARIRDRARRANVGRLRARRDSGLGT